MNAVDRLTPDQLNGAAPLAADQLRLLADALAFAFVDHNDLNLMLSTRYGQPLANLAAPGLTLPQTTERLVLVSASEGKINQLIDAACKQKPGSIRLVDARRILIGDINEGSRDHRCRVDAGRLPIPANPDLFVGRADEIRLLNDSWERGDKHIVQFVADGGVGKSMIAWRWLEDLRDRRYPGCTQVFDWSYYSQGHREYATDSRKFLESAGAHFGLAAKLSADELRRDDQLGRAVGEAFLREGGVLILDGVEPLQNPPDINGGSLKDPGLATLLRQVRGASPPGPSDPRRLLIVTTRWEIPELRATRSSSIKKVDLIYLSDEKGAELLHDFVLPEKLREHLHYEPGREPRKQLIEQKFREVSREYNGHALALVLLASYLLKRHGGDIGQYSTVDPVHPEWQNDPYRHARRVMESYDRLFQAEGSEAIRQVLLLIGLFDQPAPVPLVNILRKAAITGLTDKLVDDDQFGDAVNELQRLRLLTGSQSGTVAPLDTHPLVREHFGQSLRQRIPAAWLEANSRLFDHLGSVAKTLPASIEEMDPLFQAIPFGCKAQRYRDAYVMYDSRVMRGDQKFAAEELNALGPLVSLLSHFFEEGRWGERVTSAAENQVYDDDQYLTLVMHAGELLTATRGYAAPAVKQCYRAAIDMCTGKGAARIHIGSGTVWPLAILPGA